MKACAYYNEIDPYAAQWLRNLIAAGHIMDGEVDSRSIVEVQPDDVKGFTRCHFFAGIGGWDLALQLAGWPADRLAWTGSCPCQPFSVAGKGAGTSDERHLWPEWFRLIRESRPRVIFGEQVETAINHGWLDLVHADLEAERERDELARWRDEAVANCAKRQCSLRDRRLAELEAERDELRAALARAEAAGMQKEGIEP